MPDTQKDLKVIVRALPDLTPSRGVLLRQLTGSDLSQEEAEELLTGLFPPKPKVPEVPAEDKWNGFGVNLSLPESLLDLLEHTLMNLEIIAGALKVVVDVVGLFVNTIGSTAKLLDTILGVVQDGMNSAFEDLNNTGIYSTVIFPPALNENLVDNPRFARLSSGGFPGFISTLKGSFADQSDLRAPKFSRDALVGGLVLMVDTATIDDLYSSLDNVLKSLGLLDLAPITVAPLPPPNLRGLPGLYATGKKDILTGKPVSRTGVLVEWDKPPVQSLQFRISRSQRAGGIFKEVEDKGTTFKEKIDILWKKAQGKGVPKVWKSAYDDPTFNGGSPKIVTMKLNGSGEYLDQDIKPDESGDPPPNYYYTVESGGPGGWGPPSAELSVAIFDCIPEGMGEVVQTKDDYYLLDAGFGGLGKWSSAAIKNYTGFLPQLQKMLNTLLDSMRGTNKDASDALSDMAKNIQIKVKNYLLLVGLITEFIEIIKGIGGSASISVLNVFPETGGAGNFVKRIESAELPDGVDSFSGSSGYTAGVVLVYGTASTDAFGRGLSESDAEKQIEALKSAMGVISGLFGG